MTGTPDQEPRLVSADWGTSSLRLYLLGANGRVLDRIASADGMSSVAHGAFANVLADKCAPWREAGTTLPVLLSGMVGSRQGWREAAYVRCPAGLAEIATRLTPVAAAGFASVHIVAGMDTVDGDGIPDVMRGEECQIFGALASMGLSEGRFVLPGTHSKWVDVADGRIVAFRTFMTGEIYAALRHHTILGRMMPPSTAPVAFDEAAFARGVETARRAVTAGAWLHRLFSVRTLGLMGQLAEVEAPDYLSGLMIGWELAAFEGSGNSPIVVIGAPELARRYDRAAAILGLAMRAAPDDCVCAGHWQIASAAGLVPAALA